MEKVKQLSSLRLWMIRYVESDKFVSQSGYFSNKEVAKKERNALNTASGSIKYKVSFGPDHKKFNRNNHTHN